MNVSSVWNPVKFYIRDFCIRTRKLTYYNVCLCISFSAPSMPQSFNVTSFTATSVSLTWMPPTSFNGPPSTVYQISYNREDSTSSPNMRLIFGLRTTISGLEADVTYLFSVRGSTSGTDGEVIWGDYSTIIVLNGKVLYLFLQL